ncbi:MAG: hypothetical protein HKN74_10330 [Acidimicrobiia bacterium]|nr:hypothetical protein [Acidimicrobiia bacterium]MBT8217740.1 hypothetical protein [Acidimicrobiia bacterium]NNF10670.1 hypothetical protein [Acidimicrobiia bacterium]NNL70888.1 hypothetical protein [Acidimicrobiia bacterium]
MTDAQLIDRLAGTDVYMADVPLPDEIWSADFALQEIERRTGMQTEERGIQELGGSPTEPRTPRRRWLVPALAAGLAVVVAVVVAIAVLASGDEEVPDVGNTTVPETLPESAVLTPLEVGETLNRFTREGNWEAARELYDDVATFKPDSTTPVGRPMAELAFGDNFNYAFDWDGDGTYSIFDREAGYLMNAYVAGVTDRFSCTQTDATTVVCDIVSAGDPFQEGIAHSNTYTVVDGRIAELTYEWVDDSGFFTRDRKIEYQDWVRANRGELNVDDGLFPHLGSLLVTPETAEVHRELIAEWKAQR